MKGTITIINKESLIIPILTFLAIFITFWAAYANQGLFAVDTGTTLCSSLKNWACEPVYTLNIFAGIGFIALILLELAMFVSSLTEIITYEVPYIKKNR